MKLTKLALMAAIACGTYASNALADQPNDIRLVSCASCDCGEPVCGCEEVACCDADPCCDSGCDAGCCDSGCCDSGCCDSGFGLGLMDHFDDMIGCGDCCLGDPCSLFGECGPYSAGGWVQTGFHTSDLPIFNDRSDRFNLHQAWLWAERSIDTSCGFDIGGRIDYVYGIDAQNTQAFGTDPRGWDNDWDHGEYGHALPQLYLEAGYGDMSVKVGHFYTIIGNEVVNATGNFVYSHAYTFNYSEPFTHTGALATYNYSDDLTLYGGYVLGWDSGFDDNGDAFLGGISAQLTCDWSVTYAAVGGRFDENRFRGPVETGYMQSFVSTYNVSDCCTWITQSDYLDTEDVNGNELRNTYGYNNYLIHEINDCWSAGARFEWWAVRAPVTGRSHIYALTLGVNHRPHANVIVRPEIRFDWNDDRNIGGIGLEDNDDSQTTFGMDTIVTF